MRTRRTFALMSSLDLSCSWVKEDHLAVQQRVTPLGNSSSRKYPARINLKIDPRETTINKAAPIVFLTIINIRNDDLVDIFLV